MSVFKKYPEIENLHKVPEIFLEPEVVVTEKIHGINVRFGWVAGGFRIGGRNMEFDFGKSDDNEAKNFVGWMRATEISAKVEALAEALQKEIIFYGEWHGRGVKKNIRYSDIKNIRIFAVRVTKGEDSRFVDWDKVVELAGIIGLTTVPVLYRGIPSSEVFDDLRIKPSVVAYENGVGNEAEFAEGVVIIPNPMHLKYSTGDDEKWIMAKYKNPIHEERKSLREFKRRPLKPEGAEEFVEEFFTSERLEHVLDGLEEQGVDVASRASIGIIIKSMFDDVIKESKEEFQNLSDDVKHAVGKLHAAKTKALLNFLTN